MDVNTANNAYLIFQILYGVTALGVVIIVISENRNPIKTISWVLILLLLPLVGLFIYYFFGEDNRKRRLISKKMYKKINRKSLDQLDIPENLSPPIEYRGLANLLNKVKECPLYDGNKITFYNNGVEKFEALFEEIKRAKEHIHIQYYIYMDDEIGCKLRDLLIEKVKEGVEVRLLYDDVGSWKAKNKFYANMEKQGIKVQPFLQVRFPLLTSRVNYRNHRKLVVIDGTVGFMGGMNVADRYIKGIKQGIWRDSHIKIEGKAVHGLQTSFIIDWYASQNELLSSRRYYPPITSQGDNMMQIATSGPTGEFKEIHQGIFHAIANAKSSIYIQTPYFIPTESLLLALQTAALSGVEIHLMIPKHSDTTFVHIASLSYIKQLLAAKINVHFFLNGFIHSKLMVIDDSLVITGSANMDVRSFEHNFEIDAFIYNEKSALKAKNIFFADLESCETVTFERWKQRRRIQKFKESILRMFTPLL